MRERATFGAISLAFGVAAIAMASAAISLKRSWLPAGGYVLRLLDSLGLVRSPPGDRIPVLEATSLLMVNDEGALGFLTVYGLCFAAFAVLIALFAEYEREATGYLSAGFICGSLAIALFSVGAALGTMIAGGIFVTLARRRS